MPPTTPQRGQRSANSSTSTSPTTPSTPSPFRSPSVSPQKLDALLRLPNFTFRRPATRGRNKGANPFHPTLRATIARALGAETRTGRAGRQATVARRVGLVFRHAVRTHRLFPSFELETEHFWDAVLDGLRREDGELATALRGGVVMEVVGVYADAYVREHGEGEGREEEEEEEEEEELRGKGKSPATPPPPPPRKALLDAVREWCEIFREYRHDKTERMAERDAPAYPPRKKGEMDGAYIARLQAAAEEVAANRARQEAKARRVKQVSEMEHEKDRMLWYAAMDRLDGRLNEMEWENRLLQVGGTEEDDPWVPWKVQVEGLGLFEESDEDGGQAGVL
ncbi:hypothetical protein M406DRAFT_331884 [Cryphonectria parasitica EP155]|uniref:Uncharacterized protein n=1 Tax=Cryphonectria parasitica (strain ATCC 38755 / EP155) TaxID=660469 RepID=A0A9P4XYZ1_CRYP1|nr:uncharacterized protein M406DRAFT_331884 [Cryphonectria parasitica EP155]KAF3763360.1 hypothetical protein M406DRAFT_331884 [Cryphonectria parasitica EP155]